MFTVAMGFVAPNSRIRLKSFDMEMFGTTRAPTAYKQAVVCYLGEHFSTFV
jgi:hypothetical protein